MPIWVLRYCTFDFFCFKRFIAIPTKSFNLLNFMFLLLPLSLHSPLMSLTPLGVVLTTPASKLFALSEKRETHRYLVTSLLHFSLTFHMRTVQTNRVGWPNFTLVSFSCRRSPLTYRTTKTPPNNVILYKKPSKQADL